VDVIEEQGDAQLSGAEVIVPDSGAASVPALTAIILTYNEAANIGECVESLLWTDRVVVVDCYSEDETIELAQAAGAEIESVAFENFAQQRNAALDLVKSDWVYFVDADERGSDAQGQEIRLRLSEQKEVAWYVPRHNYIFGKLTLGAGWFPDYQLRLFRQGFVRYERPVHEVAVVDGAIGYLSHPLIHYNYLDPDHFHRKQCFYTEYDAGVLKERGIHPKPYTYLTQPLRQFWWRFVALKGYRDGFHGLRLSLYMSYYEWLKYRNLSRMWQEG
jgi:hypothetical protein